jgi:hypothetical protein
MHENSVMAASRANAVSSSNSIVTRLVRIVTGFVEKVPPCGNNELLEVTYLQAP